MRFERYPFYFILSFMTLLLLSGFDFSKVSKIDFDKVVGSDLKKTTAIPPELKPKTCPVDLPNPTIAISGTEIYSTSSGTFKRYKLQVLNYSDYPNLLFTFDSSLPPCGLNNNSSRSWVKIFDSEGGYIYGFCALEKSEDLQDIWFSVASGDTPPAAVKVVIVDRFCDKEYQSNIFPIGDISVSYEMPIISGIGLVPRTYIDQTNGLATTGPGHQINVINAPFGEHLRIMGNIQKLRDYGVTQYIIGYCKIENSDSCFPYSTGNWKYVNDTRTNYYWDNLKSKFVLDNVTPTVIWESAPGWLQKTKAYPVLDENKSWYFPNLLFDWRTTETTKIESGLYAIQLWGYNGKKYVSLPAEENSMKVYIDNTYPEMKINYIKYNGEEINACGIQEISDPDDSLLINVSAYDPDGHLRIYNLKALYGGNQNLQCETQEYDPDTSGPKWFGALPSIDIECSGFPFTCGYTFFLDGWGRAINGYSPIHYRSTHKTITLMVP